MWITRDKKEERLNYVKCMAFGSACIALLMGMMILL